MNNLLLNYRRYLFLMIIITCCNDASAQSVLQYDAISPNVGSLLRVENMPVNLYTGRPNICIPLHTIALKNYSYDIQLMYNAEGNKPDMPVGNVGLGWSVTGGQITRIANGVWDEVYTFTQYLDRTEKQTWNQESNLRPYYDDVDNGTDENFEKEPDLDEFIINIGQINASFYMYRNREGEIVTKIASQNNVYFEVKDVKIGSFPEIPFAEDALYVSWMDKTYYPKISIVPRPVMFKEITIVDSDGVTYIFGGDVQSIDFSCEYFQDPTYGEDYNIYGDRKNNWGQSWEDYHSCLYAIPSAWHIKKIILPNEKESIDFHYSNGNVNIMERLDLHKSSAFGMYGPVESNTVSYVEIPITVDPEYYLLRNKTYDIVYPSSLTGIYASNGDFVEFVSSKRNDLKTYGRYERKPLFLRDNYGGLISEIAKNKCYSLKLDKIKTGTGRTVDFYYTDENARRLTLDSLKIDRNEAYKFQYNPQRLPDYSTTLTDNWGYYNGKNYNTQSWSVPFGSLYAIRQPDSTYVKAEILEKMIYPTGGEAQFQYELHSYSKIATQYPFEIKEENGLAGGVRIKKIIYSDNGNPQTTKTQEFLYQNEDGTSSGILSVVPCYAVEGRDYSTESNTQMNWVDQFHMGYSRITELLSDGSRTVYSFTNHDLVKDEPSVGSYTHGVSDFLHNKYTSRKLDRGLLQSTKYYDSTHHLLKKEIFKYHSDLSDYLKTINQYYFIGGYPRRVSANKIYTHFPFLQKKMTTLYVGCDSINETEEYEYNQYRLLTCTKKYANGQDTAPMMETDTRYLPELMDEYDRATSGSSIPESSPLKVYDTMRVKGLLNYPIETVTKRDGKVVAAEIRTYKLSEKLMVPEKEYKLETDVPLEDYSSFKLTSSTQQSIDPRCVVEKEYLDYDSNANPTNITDKTNVNTAYLWGYNGKYPIAKVANARNTFKSTLQYKDVIMTEAVNLQDVKTNGTPKTYKFRSSKAGTVTVHLEGESGYNWHVQLNVDGKIIHLVQNRSYVNAGEPWTTYGNTYTFRQDIYLPAGSHELIIQTIQAYNSTSLLNYYGRMTFSYWGAESSVATSGSDDFFYENFEYNSPSFGCCSKSSYTGAYTISMKTNPQRKYFIDYQVFKNGKWNYIKRDFTNDSTTIDESIFPIDNVRVYPKDASITTYDYFSLIGLRSETDEKGLTKSYMYDDSGRLTTVMDNNQNIVEKYDYFYQGQPLKPDTIYYNKEVSQNFTRNTCDESIGELGKSAQYVVPAKKYSSSSSQEDADQKAYNDLLTNGQQYANEHAECSQNIILHIYNITEEDCLLFFNWGTQGSLRDDYYYIPPCQKVADTGDPYSDYESVTIYIPKRYYRQVKAVLLEDKSIEKRLIIEAFPDQNYDIVYDLYPYYEDTYIIHN